MKFLGTLSLVFLTLILFSCDSTDTSIITTENPTQIASDSAKPIVYTTQTGFALTKEINGLLGGEINFDSTLIDENNDTVTIQIALVFDANSFSGTQQITIVPDANTGSIQFTPAMVFNKPAKLDLEYSGINLTNLGFTSNSTIDFVYMADNGNIEYILKNECKIKWNNQRLYVKKAELPHFSRYAFVRKSI